MTWARRGLQHPRCDSGVSVVEYAVLAGMFGLAVIAGGQSLAGEFDSAYDNRQPQYGTPHATNQTTTTGPTTSTTAGPTTTTTEDTGTTTTTASDPGTTTTTTAPQPNQSAWTVTAHHITLKTTWLIRADMRVMRNDGTPYANAKVVMSYFDANNQPIEGPNTPTEGFTDADGYVIIESPGFAYKKHKKIFVAITSVGGNSAWDGHLSTWIARPV